MTVVATNLGPSKPRTHQPAGDNRLMITMQNQKSVYDVVTTFARVGASITQIQFKNETADVSYQARPLVVRRMPALLRNIVGVIGVECKSGLDT